MSELNFRNTTLTLCLIIPVIFFSIRAVNNLTTDSISTRFQYRFGDDNQGNIELMAITICLGRFKDHKNATTFNLLETNSTFPDLSWNIVDIFKLIKLGGGYAFYSNEIEGFWKPVLDWKFGQCYTFDPKEHGMFKVPLKDPNSVSSYLSQFLMFNVSVPDNRDCFLGV